MASKNASGSGTIRKKSVTRNGKAYTYWEARVTIGRNPGTGKPIQKSFSGKTQKEVREKMQAAAVSVNDGDFFEPSKVTLGKWLDVWTAEYMGDKKYATQKTYKANVETHIKPALGSVKLAQLAPHNIQTFYNALLSSGCTVPKRGEDGKLLKKDGKPIYEAAPMSAKTVRNIHGTLTKALVCGRQYRVYPQQPGRPRYLTPCREKRAPPTHRRTGEELSPARLRGQLRDYLEGNSLYRT